ncbi:hypothetical protein [Paenibacillus soyae]|uniref:Uncharacterized protein n=1 Tax=Paenibacillus soyae TaxID=2969249 RepID=A0A9X2MLX5_9BACL|nr:hypothetical protein [Paenibacillus soyae]MCR2802529.1 hypothetical protein [Paenibacillus soyae]
MPLCWYSVKGLSLTSEVPMPSALRSERCAGKPDVTIRIDPFLKNGLDAGRFVSDWSPSIATVCIPEVGVLRILNGERVVVSPFAGADEERLQQCILYYGMNALFEQRGDSEWNRNRLSVISQAMNGPSEPAKEVVMAHGS